jgi:hypothetical protein
VITITHSFVDTVPDGPDPTVVRPSNWNAVHAIVGNINLALDVVGILPSTNGGTSNGFTQFSGPTTSTRIFTLPNSSQSIACLDLQGQLVSGGATVNSSNLGTQSSGTLTPDCGRCPLQYVTNNGAFTLAAPAADGSMMLLVTNGATAGTISFTGFSIPTSPGDALDTTNGHKFTFTIWRINAIAGFRIAAHQ